MSKKTITFSAALNTRIEQYAAMHAEMDFNTAVRELVNLGLSAAPTDELMVQARRHAFDKTRHWALSEVAIKFREVADSAEKQLGAYRADEEER
ncbi:MAG: hypothetical protein KA310_03365 [Pseudomonadales bacterium]|nr:hypothetical protein [Pseudomonadales bacterium]